MHLIGCSVLMITNLIDKPKWYLYLSMLIKQVLQTGIIVDCTNWLQIRTGLRMIKTLTLIADIDWDQDQLLRGIKWLISRTVSDQETRGERNQRWFSEQHKLGWWSMHADSKTPSCVSRVFIFIVFIFIDSCVNCKFLPDKKSLNHTR